MALCLSVNMEWLGPDWRNFHEIFCCIYTKMHRWWHNGISSPKIKFIYQVQFWFRSDKSKILYMKTFVNLWYLVGWKTPMHCRENQNTTFVTFSRKSCHVQNYYYEKCGRPMEAKELRNSVNIIWHYINGRQWGRNTDIQSYRRWDVKRLRYDINDLLWYV